METVGKERKDHHLLWWKALGGEITRYIIRITIALVVQVYIISGLSGNQSLPTTGVV
jgi:hypothetical protein